MPKGYFIDAAGIQKLRDDHEQLRRQVHSLSQKITATAGSGVRSNIAWAKVTTIVRPLIQNGAGLAAGTGWVGGGKAKIYRINRTATAGAPLGGLDRTFELSADEIDVYNSTRNPIPVDAKIIIRRDFSSGLWMCGDSECAIAKSSSTGIPARSGTAAGNGLANFYYIAASGTSGTLTNSGSPDVNVWNLSATAVVANTYITLKRISYLDQWVVDAEDCG
tara:strand:- start:486 stop:1145 length:660 start_codon:yes stop_codon:yes gene_type:complete